MLPKHRRLSALEVRRVLAEGRSARSTHLSMKYVANKGGFRVAVVAPKSLARKATERNRLRRGFYGALTTLPGQLALSGMAVFFIKSIPKGPLVSSLREDLSSLVSKISHV